MSIVICSTDIPQKVQKEITSFLSFGTLGFMFSFKVAIHYPEIHVKNTHALKYLMRWDIYTPFTKPVHLECFFTEIKSLQWQKL